MMSATFQSRRNHAPMKRRRRPPAAQGARLFIVGLRRSPPGRKAPERTTPPPQIDRRAAEAHFLAAIEAWDQVDRTLLPERRANLFVKHPRMGDLTVEEWMRFHVIHARHHARQIRERVGGGVRSARTKSSWCAGPIRILRVMGGRKPLPTKTT